MHWGQSVKDIQCLSREKGSYGQFLRSEEACPDLGFIENSSFGRSDKGKELERDDRLAACSSKKQVEPGLELWH